jgi:hypothetical protein
MGGTCNTHDRNEKHTHNTLVGKLEVRISAILNLTQDDRF